MSQGHLQGGKVRAELVVVLTPHPVDLARHAFLDSKGMTKAKDFFRSDAVCSASTRQLNDEVPSLAAQACLCCNVRKPHPWGAGQTRTHLFLPEQVRAGADSSALVRFLQQLGTVARGLVHQHVPVLWGEDAALVQGAHNALQRCDLCFAVRDGFFVQNECLRSAAESCSAERCTGASHSVTDAMSEECDDMPLCLHDIVRIHWQRECTVQLHP